MSPTRCISHICYDFLSVRLFLYFLYKKSEYKNFFRVDNCEIDFRDDFNLSHPHKINKKTFSSYVFFRFKYIFANVYVMPLISSNIYQQKIHTHQHIHSFSVITVSCYKNQLFFSFLYRILFIFFRKHTILKKKSIQGVNPT